MWRNVIHKLCDIETILSADELGIEIRPLAWCDLNLSLPGQLAEERLELVRPGTVEMKSPWKAGERPPRSPIGRDIEKVEVLHELRLRGVALALSNAREDGFHDEWQRHEHDASLAPVRASRGIRWQELA
jgi:hypothetical protein